MARILVTGVSGFIGRHLLEEIADEHYVIGIDIKYSETEIQEFYMEDINNISNLPIRDVDLVVHLAASIDARDREETSMIKNNVLGLYEIIRFMHNNNITKMFFPSSFAVYGNKNRKVKENDKLNPINTYGVSKHVGEDIIKQEIDEYIIGRFSNVYGYGGKGVVSIFIEKALKGEDLIVYGRNTVRDFIYIKDIVSFVNLSINRLLGDKKRYKETINVCSGYGKYIKDVAKTIKEMVGSEVKVIYRDKDVFDIEYSVGDNKKLIDMFGIRLTKFEDGIKETIDEYKKYLNI